MPEPPEGGTTNRNGIDQTLSEGFGMRSILAALGLLLLCRGSSAGDLPDLATRKQGSDWPRFLGPTGDSVSTETGILTKWPKEGLRVVWSKRLGEGYAMPAISRGRAFVFDRVRDEQRLQ